MTNFIQNNWAVIFSGIGTAVIAAIIGALIRWKQKSSSGRKFSQSAKSGQNSQVVQGGRDATGHYSQSRNLIKNMAKERQAIQEASAGDHAIILQAGRDAILQMEKSPPKIRLVRVTIDDDDTEGVLKQKINIIMKNVGDTTAFLQRGLLLTEAKEEIVACSKRGMQLSISEVDWTYEVDIDDVEAEFVGRHSIAPNEVVNFDVSAGRRVGGFELTIYRCKLKFDFDEARAPHN